MLMLKKKKKKKEIIVVTISFHEIGIKHKDNTKF